MADKSGGPGRTLLVCPRQVEQAKGGPHPIEGSPQAGVRPKVRRVWQLTRLSTVLGKGNTCLESTITWSEDTHRGLRVETLILRGKLRFESRREMGTCVARWIEMALMPAVYLPGILVAEPPCRCEKFPRCCCLFLLFPVLFLFDDTIRTSYPSFSSWHCDHGRRRRWLD